MVKKGAQNQNKSAGRVRIGIDVGGTFTHAVALESDTLEILGKSKVPTTHTAPEGVALGIIQSLKKLLEEAGIAPEQVGFIAHSTTQATNALLEGDVATVGILGMGSGANAWIAKAQTNLGKIELAPGKFITTHHEFIDTTKAPTEQQIKQALENLVKGGVGAIAISEAFSVDDSKNEKQALEIALSMGLLVCAGSEITQLYGLKVRTRTAVINASMLPKMIESANMTESSVKAAGILAPVMIMRSDGGVMDVEAMRKRPILTMLSGPAAGVAAAMMFLHISDGIFLEVGGTSTDISAIANGRALVRSAEIGGHKVYMKTLDVRTVGVAGGSMPRVKGQHIVDVGPRSAHIAGLKYASFQSELAQQKLDAVHMRPLPKDPDDYVAIKVAGTETPTVCITPTCASNLLDLVPSGDCAEGNKESIKAAFKPLSAMLSKTDEEAATELLDVASKKCIPIVKALMKDYKLDEALVNLVGGGGGSAAIVPFVAKQLQMRHKLAEHADVISAIGVALALVRESVERQILNPSNDDILRIRHDAHSAVERMGADPATIEVHVEIDARTSTIRATAVGATSMTDPEKAKTAMTEDERLASVADSLRVDAQAVSKPISGAYFSVYEASKRESKYLGFMSSMQNSLRIVDAKGVIRLQCKDGSAQMANVSSAISSMESLIEKHSSWGDAGRVIPNMVLLAGPKIVDLSGLLDAQQISALAKAELEFLPKDAEVIVIAKVS